MKRRILIRGAEFENKGSEAMIRCVQQRVIASIPDAVGLLDMMRGIEWSPQELRGLEPRIGLRYRGRFRRMLATAVHAFRGLSREACLRSVGAVAGIDTDIDAVIDISGYGFHDAPPGGLSTKIRRGIADMFVTDTMLLAGSGVPFIYLPQCWGPLRQRRSKRVADRRMRSALRLYARDRESLEWLKTLPSFTEDKVALASDIAFTFEGAPQEVGRELLGEIGIRLNEAPLVGIVPNMRVYQRVPGEGPENLYVRQLIEVARHFTDRHGCEVAVMPHEIKTRPARIPDDRYLCEMIADALSDGGRVRGALGDYTSEELKAMIGETDLLISSRFHGVVAAMSLRVPVVSIAWSHKYRELMDGVGLREYVVEHDQLGDASVVDLCDQAWSRRAEMSQLIDEHVPAHEASAREVLDEAVALIEECTA